MHWAIRLRFLLLLLLPLSSWAAPRFEVTQVEDGKKVSFPGDVKGRWGWITKEENVRVVVGQVALKAPQFASFQTVTVGSAGTKAFVKADTLYVQFDSLEETVVLKNATKTLKVIVRAALQGDAIIEEGCQAQHLQLESATSELPFFLGASCQSLGNRVGLTLSPPADVHFNSSTLFETKGKGESWRFYEIGNAKSGSEELAKFSLSYQGKSYEFVLKSLYKESAKKADREDLVTLLAGAGFAFLNIQGGSFNSAASNPALAAKVPFFPVAWGMGISADLDLVLPVIQGADATNYFHFDAFAAYDIILNRTFKLRPKAGYVVFSQTHTATQIGLLSNQLGFGMIAEMRLDRNNWIFLDFMTCPLNNGVTLSHYSLSAGFAVKTKRDIGWGAGGKMQSFSARSSLGVERTFSQLLVYGMLAF